MKIGNYKIGIRSFQGLAIGLFLIGLGIFALNDLYNYITQKSSIESFVFITIFLSLIMMGISFMIYIEKKK